MKTILPLLKMFGKQAGQGMFLLLMLLLTQTSYAQTNTWDGSSSANWNTASNWSLNQVPTAAHDVVIPNGITATINVNTAAVCKSLTINNGNTNNTVSITGTNSLSVSGAVSIGAGTGSGDNKVLAVNAGTLTCASVSISATGNSNRRSELTLSTGTITVTGGISMNDANNFVRFTSNGQLFVGGNITGGNLVPSTGTVTYNGVSAQIITGANTSSFYNLVINKPNATETVSSNTHAMNIANDLTVISGELILNATNANYIVGHDLSIQSSGTLTHNVGWAAFSRSLNVRGDWNHLGGTFNPGTGRVFFDGTSNQLLTGSQSTVFHGVSINNGNHVSLSSVDMIISGGAGALQFVNGRVITGANKVQLCETCSITGATNTRYVDGNLQMAVASGNQVKIFAVGSASAYAPVTLTLNNVTNAGAILISTPGVEHPDIQNSLIDESRNVNRYWSVQNIGVLFTNANVSFQFQVSDVDAIANSNAFIIAQHNGSWVYPSVSAQTATSINTNGLTEFGDFVVGEGGASAPYMVLQPVNQTACQSAQAVFTSSASGKPGSSVQWQVSTDGGNNFVNITPGAPYTVNTTQAGNQTNSSLTINPVAIGLDQYDYRAIFNNSRGSVTSDPARLTVTGITVAQAGSNQTICAGLTATMAANTPTLGSGAWSVISGPSTSLAQFSQVNNPQAVFTPAGGAGTYQLRWTITLGACSNFSNVQVTVVNPPSNPNISFNEILQQSSQTIMLCGPVDPGGEHDIDIYNYSVPPGSSFAWQFNTNGGGWTNAGLPSTEDEYPVAAFAGIVGTHQFRLRLTTPAGCVVTSNVLTLNVNPVSSIGGTNQVVCSGANFTANFSGFPLFTMFSWSAPVVTGGITGGSGGLGFSLTDNLVNPTLDPQTATYTVTPIYLLSVSPSCSMSFPVTVTVYPRPTINLSPAAISVCSNTVLQTTQLHYSATTGVPSTYSISWNNTPANTFVPVNNAVLPASPISINVPANTAAGTYTGNLTVRNVNGCVSVSYPFTVTVNARPNIGNSTTALPVCYSDNNQQTTLSYNTLTNSPVSYSLSWNSSPANSFVPVTDAPLNAAPSTIAIQVPGGTAPGTFTGNLTVKNASGCVSVVKTFTLLVRPLPSADWASEAGTVCQNTVAQIVTLPYFSTINSPNTYSIQWNPSPANTFANINNAAFPGSATGGSININVPANTAAGLYTGNITVRNASGCVSTPHSFTLEVKPRASISLAITTAEVCKSSLAQDAYFPINSIGGLANSYSIQWSSTPPNGFVPVTNAALNMPGLVVQVPADEGVGNYNGTLVLHNDVGCSSANIPITVKIKPMPSVDWPSAVIYGCSNSMPQTVYLAYGNTGNSPGTYTLTWNPVPANTFSNVVQASLQDAGPGNTIGISIPPGTAPGVYSANITVSNVNGCTSTPFNFTMTINEFAPVPVSGISGTSEMCENAGSYVFTAAPVQDAVSYNWTFPAGWQINSGSGTTSITASPVTGSQSGVVSLAAVNGCGPGPSVQFPVQVFKSGTWLGYSDNWHDPANWCDGIPTLATNVLIPAGRPHNPIISHDIASAQNLTIEPGAGVVIQNQTLEIGGTIVSAGGIDALAGHIDLKGSAAQTISGSMFADKTIHELSISHPHGVQFTGASDTVKISYLLSFETNNGHLQTNGKLTLLSRASGTASIGDLTGGGQYSGNTIDGQVTVERYIPNHPKAWQFLSVPTTGQTINQAWQEGNAPMANSKPGYGAIITGNMPNAQGLGFDIATPVASGPGLKTFNSNTGLWEGVAGTHQPILPNQGYMLFVRGDRSVTAFNQSATATILRNTGTLVANGTQALPVHNVDAGKFVAVGNPFASAIDFNTIQKTGGLQDVFYVWDPKLTNSANSPYGLGGYQTFIGPGPNYTVIPGGGSFADGNTNIESGMAFFVRAEGTTGTLSFAETNKVTGSHLVTRQMARQFPQIRLNLFVNHGSNQVMLDAALSQFDPAFSNALDMMDARKLGNQGSEQISILSGAERLVAERRSALLPTDTIFYQLSGLRRQSYQFQVLATGLAGTGMMAFLEDAFTGQSTPVSLEGETTASFTVDQQPGSFAANRFRLVFRPVGPLPVEFSSIRARRLQSKSDARVDWTVGEEINIDGYQVERSIDGMQFQSVGEVSANPANRGAYTFTDITAPARVLYYRVRSTGQGGGDLSSVVKLSAIDQSGVFQVYPNPVTGVQIPLYSQGMAAGAYTFGLYNQAGQLIASGRFRRNESDNKTIISLETRPARGTYFLRIVGPENQSYQVPVQFQ